MNVEKLHNQINEIAYIVGVGIGRIDDRSTWRVHYQGEPTPQQLQAVQAIIQNFNVDEPDDKPITTKDLLAEISMLKDKVSALEANAKV